MLLAMDTSSRYGGAALADGAGAVIEARLWRTTANHTAQLMPAVAQLLAAQGIRAAELAGVAVALGPGPFSALRVGVSAAKGLALAAGFPIVGIDTLALEAGPHLFPGGVVAAWLDAGRGEVAAARFDGNGARVSTDVVAAPETLLRDEPPPPDGALMYCGEAAYARRDTVREIAGDPARPAAVAPWTPAARLWRLAQDGAERIGRGAGSDLATLQPYYLRMPTIGAPRQREIVRPGRPPSK